MKVSIKEKECVGCGLCEDTCPKVFEVKDGVAHVLVASVPADCEEACRQAAEDCPVSVIVLEDS